MTDAPDAKPARTAEQRRPEKRVVIALLGAGVALALGTAIVALA